eukprot:g36148.t1
MGLALALKNAPSSWTIPYHLSFMEKFAKKNTFDHKSIRKWSACIVLETLWEKEWIDPVGCSLSSLSNSFGRMPHHQNFTTCTKNGLAGGEKVKSFKYAQNLAQLHAAFEMAAGEGKEMADSETQDSFDLSN